MFALLPTSRKDEIVEYAINNAIIRDGFEEFVDYCKEQEHQASDYERRHRFLYLPAA